MVGSLWFEVENDNIYYYQISTSSHKDYLGVNPLLGFLIFLTFP